MAPRSLKNSKATFWGVKDRERYVVAGVGTEGSWGSHHQKKKKPLCFYAKRLSRESGGQLGQWRDWTYMCLGDFFLRRRWFSCLSSLSVWNQPHLGLVFTPQAQISNIKACLQINLQYKGYFILSIYFLYYTDVYNILKDCHHNLLESKVMSSNLFIYTIYYNPNPLKMI